MYTNTNPEQLTLRDHLARDRTVLANERTLLSYLRTAFGMLAGGVTLLKLFPDDRWLGCVGVGLLVAGTLVTAVGTWRFSVVNARLRRILVPAPARSGVSSTTRSE